MNTAKNFARTAASSAPLQLTYQRLQEAIETATVMSFRQRGLEPDAEHDYTTPEYAAMVKKATGIVLTNSEKIKLGQAAGMQGRRPRYTLGPRSRGANCSHFWRATSTVVLNLAKVAGSS